MQISIKKIIVPSIPLAALLVVCCLAIWISTFLGGRFNTLPNQSTILVQNIQTIILPNTLLSNLVSLLFTLANAFLLAQINNRFTIIRNRTFLPIVIFLLLMSTWSETHASNGSHISLTLFILALFHFFSMSRDKKASEQAFMGSFLISVSSIFINPLIYMIPICLIGFMIFQSFSLRTFLAAIFGTVSPWIIYLSIRYLLFPDSFFLQAFMVIPTIDLSLPGLSLPDLIYIGSITAIMIISLVSLFSLTHSDAIHTRNKLNFMAFILVCLLVLVALFRSQYVSFLPLIAMVYSILISHPLTLRQNNFHGILFWIFCFLNIAYVISKYILT